MEFLRNSLTEAGNYLGLNSTEPATAGLNTRAPDSGAVSASQLETRKELHDELLQTGSQNLQSSKPDSSAKAGLHEELLHSDKSNLLHPVDNSAEIRLNKEKYEPIALESHPELAYETLKSEEPREETLKSRPEFQRNPLIFTPAFQSSGSYEQDQIRSEPNRLERIEKEQVVREHVHPIVKEEIQPVIYREREQMDVKQVTQMLHETQIQPTRVEERQLPAQYREDIIQSRGPIQENLVLPSRQIDETSHSRTVHQPIVNEVIKKRVVEEIQPVVERDVYQTKLVQTQRPIYEKIVEAPIVTREVIGSQELGTHTTGHRGVVEQAPLPLSQSSYSHGSYSQASSSSSYTMSESDLLASRGYGHLASGQSQQVEFLPTGQVLPAVASTRPAYSYLPRGTSDKRPDFIGNSSQYAVAANGGALPAKSQFVNPLLPQSNNYFPNSAPQTLQHK